MSPVTGSRGNGNRRQKEGARGLSLDAIDAMESEHEELFGLCDELEHIADELPVLGERSRFTLIARRLNEALAKHYRHAEQLLVPLLSRRALPDDRIDELARGLRRDHRLDEGYAMEVQELLDDLATGGRPVNMETAGYLLRGFFEGLRRHLRCEELTLYPLARRRLSRDDLSELAAKLAADQH